MSKTVAKRKSSGVADLFRTLVYAGLMALGIRTFLVEPFNIPSGSMIPTLLIGDYLFVSKFSYGYSRFSFPWPLSVVPFSGRIPAGGPARGDVAVFKLPSDTSIDYIKRIVGLPGDRIQVRGGNLYINGELAKREPAGDCNYPETERHIQVVQRRYLETLPGGVTHYICKATDDGQANNTPEYLVPPERVFAMGDNRDNSLDSRFMTTGVGFVPMENIVGRAEFIFFSIDADHPVWQFWWWPFEIRWSRLLSGIR